MRSKKKIAEACVPTPDRTHKISHQTSSGLKVNELYKPEPESDQDYLTRLGFPGTYPYTRGVHPTMYQGRLWTMRQYSGFGTAEETNKRYKFLLQRGQTGLSIAFDLPTQMGYDSDHPLSSGEVGKTGVAISSLQDMETLFNGIPLDKVSVSMTINATCPVILGMYLIIAEQQGVALDKLAGTVQNDILKEYTARGAYMFPPQPSLRLVIDIIEYCIKHIPRWNFISISGYHIREAGSTAAQELGFTLANGIEYVKTALKRGLDVNTLGNRISFFFNAHNDFFEEIAKFRAARRLWARIMKERFNATDPRAMMLRFHTQTAGCTLTAQQPDNNVTRVALQAMSAVLGGTQSLHTNSRDEALSLPTEKSAQIALRTQQLLAYESGVTKVIDPLGGSYYVETLTNQIEKMAEALIAEIDQLGGALKAIEQGYQQRAITKSAYNTQLAIEKQQQITVGVNEFADEMQTGHRRLTQLKINKALQEKQVRKIKQYKGKRKAKAVRTNLSDLKDAALSKDNLMPPIVSALKTNATLGEICQVLREVFGEYKSKVVF